jgi:hypothetical protein
VTHGSQVVNFRRPDFGNNGNQVGCIAQVTIMKKQFHASVMAIFVDMVDASCVERRGTTDDAMDLMEAKTTALLVM